MADFRKWFYALAVVVLLAGFIVPASAQTSSVNCNNGGATPPLVRSEGLTELTGDLVLTCSGGPNGTPANQVVPQVNITVILSVNITSKITAGGLFNEALLIIDEPNQSAPGTNSNRPILNCGNAGAPDNSIESGPGVCSIVSDGNPGTTYNGVPNKFGTGTCATSTFGCGSPNIFQGRQGTVFGGPASNPNSISFLGVPFDPPGTGTTRTLRFTNIRANANQDAIASTFLQQPIVAQVAINGNAPFGINVPSQGQTVAFVHQGLIASVIKTRLDFVQCNTENGKLATGTAIAPGSSPFGTPAGGGANGGGGTNPFSNTPTVRLAEGFASSWKVRNVSEILANGTFVGGTSYLYNGFLLNPADLNQNVPGVSYNTEAGFEYSSNPAFSNPSPQNPPAGFGGPATGAITGGTALADSSTGITQAGIATQGTRLYLTFAAVPQGSNIFVPPVIFFYRQNQSPVPVPATYTTSATTGVAVLISTDTTAAASPYTPTQTLPTTQLGNLAVVGTLAPVTGNLAVYEVLFDDPLSLEQVDIPVVVAFVSQLSQNPPFGLPATIGTPNGGPATVGAGFAPFYAGGNAFLPASTSSFPIPRFTPGNADFVGSPILFEINKCACDLLFPFVSSQGGFDTGIAIANTSLDPSSIIGAAFGPGATPQQGTVTFFYFGVGANGAAPPSQQTSAVVPAGQVLTYVLSSGGGAIGTGANGLTASAAGFQGYIIAQAQFQYCHAYAFVSALGGGPTSPGVSEGYLGLILDLGGLPGRTAQLSENLVH